MSNSNINRIESIVPYSKLLGNYLRPSSTISKSLRNVKDYEKAIEEREKEMDEKENVERIQKNKEQEALFKEKLKKNYGNELFAREIDEVGELKTNELSLGECEKKLKMCGICGGHLDPSNFGNEYSVVIVGDGRHTYPELEHLKNQEDLGRCIEQHGVGPRTKKLGITFGQLYNEYTKKCKTRVCDFECLSKITTNKYLEEMSKRFSYTDIVCGHKFHKQCIWGEIKKQEGRLHEQGTLTGGVNCPTCGKRIRKLYYFLPTYCDKIDENGQFIVRKNQPAMATLGKNDTKQNKTKKKLTFADNNEMRFYEKGSVTDDFFGGRGKRKRVRKTRRKNRKHKKTRKYKKN